MDLKSLKANGADLTPAQQAAFYYARKRRQARERANASEFKMQGVTLGIIMTVTLTVGAP